MSDELNIKVKVKQHFYVGTFVAVKDFSFKFEECLVATSSERAARKSMETRMFEKMPVEDGWHSHQLELIDITEDIVDKLTLAIGE